MELYLLKRIRSQFAEYSFVISLALLGFAFLIIAIPLLKEGELLMGLVFLACSLILFGVSGYHYRNHGTPHYGMTIEFGDWNETTAWKRWVFVVCIILFLLLWCYLVGTAILSGRVHLEYSCIGICDGY